MTDRISRDAVGLLIARVWSLRSTCARRRVGCLLTDADGYTLSAGYNGPAAGEPHCTDVPCPGVGLPSGTGLDRCEAVHAEANALIRCFDPRRIHTCYVTASPCVTCTKLLMSTACVRIVFAEEYPHVEARALWLKKAVVKHAIPGDYTFEVPLREWVYLPYAKVEW